jgi:surfactin synthase thioesterase subunit
VGDQSPGPAGPLGGSPWLVQWRADQHVRGRLICIGHAGAGAGAFRAWRAVLARDLDLAAVRLPGRESRLREQPIDDLAELRTLLARELRPLLSFPTVLFGHCSGANVAFELARALLEERPAPIAGLIVASQVSPRLRAAANEAPLLPGEDLQTRIERLGGTDPAVLANDALFSLLEPALRADFALTDTYTYRPGAPLDIPITVIAGADDVNLDGGGLQDWERETSVGCQIGILEGNHFFSGDGWQALGRRVARISEEMARHYADST